MPTVTHYNTPTTPPKPTLIDRLRGCRDGLRSLIGVWQPSIEATKWDKRPTWDDWNKSSGGKPWDNQPSWDNWDKRKK